MTQAASQASAFYREVGRSRRLWTVRDKLGFPTSTNGSGEKAMPFWSSLARAKKIIKTVPAYAGFEPFEISWDEFARNWVPGLTKDGIRVGVNWSGVRALGYDISPEQVARNVEATSAAVPTSEANAPNSD